MPTELLAALPQLAALIEKLGVVGLLLVAVGWLVYERMRLLKDLVVSNRNLNRWRLASTKYRDACDHHGIKVDMTDLADLIESTT